MFISKKLSFFQSPSRGGGCQNVRRSDLFQGDGALLLFSIELVVFQGVPDSLYPLWIRALPMQCVYVCGLLKSPKTKHAVSSSKAKAFRVIKKMSPKLYFIYYVRSGKYLS